MTVITFEQLYQAYADDIFRFALYLCGSVDWAEDLTSETFVRAWTRRNSLRMPTLKAYLVAIVRNLYRQEVRRQKRFAHLDDDLPGEELSSEVSVEQRAELRATLLGLQTLPEIDRAALLLRALYEMPYQEIAAALDISPAAARVKVHRARLKLLENQERPINGG